MKRILTVLCIAVAFASCGQQQVVTQEKSQEKGYTSEVLSTSESETTAENLPTVASLPAKEQRFTLKNSGDTPCKIQLWEGDLLVIDDIVPLFPSDTYIGAQEMFDEQVCEMPKGFYPVEGEEKAVIHLWGQGYEHPQLGPVFILNIENGTISPLDEFNEKNAANYGTMVVSPDGRKGALVKKYGDDMTVEKDHILEMWAFFGPLSWEAMELEPGETFNSSSFWSDVIPNIAWLDNQTLEVHIFKKLDPAIEAETGEERTFLRKETLDVSVL